MASVHLHRRWRTVLLTLLLAAALAIAVAVLVVRGGFYDVAADRPHWQPVHALLETTMRHSVQRRARSIDEPPLDTPGLALRGAACYSQHCMGCHGAPGVEPATAAQAMQPLPGPLVDAAANWRPRELVWITRHGIRMSGMPAWGGRLADGDIWAVAAFLQQLPQVSPQAWQQLDQAVQLLDCPDEAPPPELPSEAPGPRGFGLTPAAFGEHGRRALQRHGCAGCHVIPGIVGSVRHVGPPLAGYGLRTQIKGRWPNTRENLAAWVHRPQRLDPGSAMPDTSMHEAEAQAIAAYLLTLR